jgi:16S rRNA (cytidine1402-2'-O)-methyltransferase
VDVLLAEDTRKTGRMLDMCGISRPRLLSLFEHNEQARIKQVVGLLKQGQQIALVSSAGTPLMSDPGYLLVRSCWQAGFRVSPIPGPCAPVTALMASGLPPYPFAFLGFVPRKSGEKRRLFAPYAQVPATLAFFERSNRLKTTLDDARAALGHRDVCIARELTKQYEQFIFLTLGSESLKLPELPGEVTVLVAPGKNEQGTTETKDVIRIMRSMAESEKGARSVVEHTWPQVSGWGKKALYALYLRHVQGKDAGTEES